MPSRVEARPGPVQGGKGKQRASATPSSRSSAAAPHTKATTTTTTTTNLTATTPSYVRLEGHHNLRQRIVLSLLLAKPILITSIRPDALSPGIRDFEASFLRLVEKLTNGSVVQISYTGTELSFRPGTLVGGEVSHDCGNVRGVGYFLEWIAVLAPFAKKEVSLTLTGITNGHTDMGVDLLRTVALPLLSSFLPTSLHSLSNPLELRVLARGAPPLGGGRVFFRCPLLPSFASSSGAGAASANMLRTVDFRERGKVRRIRGVAFATRVSAQMANRCVDAARSVLNRYVPDCYLFADVYRGEESGRSPGFGLSLVATTTTGALMCSEVTSVAGETPEEVGLRASRALLHEVASVGSGGGRTGAGGGCVARCLQPHALVLMACGPEDVARLRLGAPTEAAVRTLRDVRSLAGVRFRIKPVGPTAGAAAAARPGRGEAGSGSTGGRGGRRAGRKRRRLSEEGDEEHVDGEDDEGDSDEDEEEDDDDEPTTAEGEDEEGALLERLRVGPEEYIVSCVGVGVRGARKAT